MTSFLDAYRTEVDGNDVERGVGCSLEHAAEATREAIRAEGLHGVNHHAACTAAA